LDIGVWGDQQMRILGIVALAIPLAGCGVVARIEDRQEYVKARQQYEEVELGLRAKGK
jgi:hypothetical protein